MHAWPCGAGRDRTDLQQSAGRRMSERSTQRDERPALLHLDQAEHRERVHIQAVCKVQPLQQRRLMRLHTSGRPRPFCQP
eukprot:2077-Chlamydomonas_euryale.AAC.2